MPSSPAISVVVPLYNEEDNVVEMQQQIDAAMAGRDYELVLVDDDSKDQTLARVQRGDRVRVIAGSDCGFGTFTGYEFVAPDVVWAKLRSLGEGAQIASKTLWGRAA